MTLSSTHSDQIYLYSLSEVKEERRRTSVESENNRDTFESLPKSSRWKGYCVNVKGILCIKNCRLICIE